MCILLFNKLDKRNYHLFVFKTLSLKKSAIHYLKKKTVNGFIVFWKTIVGTNKIVLNYNLHVTVNRKEINKTI